MARFHVSQDETGFFQLAYENEHGELTLVSYQFDAPDQLIEDATMLAASGDFGDATVVVDPRRRPTLESTADLESRRPAPRRASD